MKFKDGSIVELIDPDEFISRRGRGALTDEELRGHFIVTNTFIYETNEPILAAKSIHSAIGFWEKEEYFKLVHDWGF